MSNASLVDAMRRDIDAYRSGNLPTQRLAKRLGQASNALEAMPYELIKELQGLLLRLELAGRDDEDGFVSEADTLIAKIESKFRSIPTNA